MSRPPHKFNPEKAGELERPERQKFLPNGLILELLNLNGTETVVDYGAGSGVLTLPLAQQLGQGVVHAVDESPEMMQKLQERVAEANLKNVKLHLIEDNKVQLENGSADRVVALNLLHEVIGESALEEMQRLLSPEGFLLIVDWRGDIERDYGPPQDVALTPEVGKQMLEAAGFSVIPLTEAAFPYHYAFKAVLPSN